MAAYTGTNNRVNGAALAGEHLTGNIDYFTIATLVPMAQTNVVTPVTYLYTQQGYSTWQSVSVIDGTGTSITYTTQTTYQNAYNKQSNLNLLLQLFATRANPVVVNYSSQTVVDPSATTLFADFLNAVDFGSAYSASATVSTIKIMTEKTLLWLVSSPEVDNNTDGYEFLNFIQGITVLDLATPVLQTAVFETDSSVNMNTIAYRSNSL